MSTPDHLKEVSTKERIELVKNDNVRRWGQIVISFILIGFSLGYLTYFTIYVADDAFKTFMANAMLTLAIAGIGAAYAIFGLGRTVGRTNPTNGNSITYRVGKDDEHEFRLNGEEIFKDKEDELRDLLEHQEEDRPIEVPPGKKDGKSPVSTMMDNLFYVLADRPSWNSPIKTIGGAKINHIATQESRRTRKKRTIHVYHIEGTNAVIYNRSRDGVYFMRMAIRPENVIQFYDTFVREPITPEEKTWLERYDYVIAN